MSFKLTELVDYLLVRSGQYILPRGLKSLRMDLDILWPLVYRCIKEYEKWNPAYSRFNIFTSSQPVFDFSRPTAGVPVSEVDGSPLVPHKVLYALPVNTLNVVSIITAQLTIFGREMYNPSRLVDPRTCLKVYRAPKLYLTEAGGFDVLAIYDYEYIFTRDEERHVDQDDPDSPFKILEVEVPVLGDEEAHQLLLDMIFGQFLISIGNARGSFVYNDFPVTTNATQLVADGTQIYKDARTELQGRHRFYLGIRP